MKPVIQKLIASFKADDGRETFELKPRSLTVSPPIGRSFVGRNSFGFSGSEDGKDRFADLINFREGLRSFPTHDVERVKVWEVAFRIIRRYTDYADANPIMSCRFESVESA